MRRGSAIVLAVLTLSGLDALAQPVCTRAEAFPQYGPKALVDGLNVRDTIRADTDGDGQAEIIGVGNLGRHAILQRIWPRDCSGSDVLARLNRTVLGSFPQLTLWAGRFLPGDRDQIVLNIDGSSDEFVTLVHRLPHGLSEIAPRIPCVRDVHPGDFDGDAIDELVIETYTCDDVPARVAMYELDAASGWQLSVDLTSLSTRDRAVGDFDEDGYDDLVSVDGSTVRTFYGDATAPFTRQGVRALNVGNPDDVVSFEENGRDGFLVAIDLGLVRRFDASPSSPASVAVNWSGFAGGRFDNGLGEVEDFDRDGLIDFTWHDSSTWATLWRGWPTTSFRVWWEPDIARRLVHAEDIDGDGQLEGLMDTSGDGILAWPSDVHGRYRDGIPRVRWRRTRNWAVGDFNGDGLDDLFLTPWYNEFASILLSEGDGGFSDVGLGLFPRVPTPYSVARDFDLDGNVDLATATSDDPAGLSLWLGAGTGGAFALQDFLPLGSARGLWARDVDRDGQTDLIYIRNSPRELVVAFVRGDELVRGPGNSFFPLVRDVADIDLDGSLDVLVDAVQEDGSFTVHAATLSADGQLGEPRSILDDSFPAKIARVTASDLDRDGDVDLFVQLERGNVDLSSVTLLNHRNRYSIAWAGPQRDGLVEAFYTVIDLNGDEIPDLVERDEVFRIRPGDGTGSFDRSTGPFSAGNQALMDIDGDGFRDVVNREVSPRFVYTRAHIIAGATVAAGDTAAPTVELALRPDAITSFTSGIQQWAYGRHRVSVVARDDCTPTEITQRRLDTGPLPPAPLVLYEFAEAESITVFENQQTLVREILLAGPDEFAVRTAFDQILTVGGWEIPNGHAMSLLEDRDLGPAPTHADLDPDAVQVARFVLADGLPTEARITHPTDDLTFTMSARDQAGRTTTVTETLQTGLARYCSRAPRIPAACE